MKKLLMTFVLALALGMCGYAQEGLFDSEVFVEQGLFGRGDIYEEELRDGGLPPVIPGHNESGNQDGDGPIGSGIAVLLGLGAAYAFAKKREE